MDAEGWGNGAAIVNGEFRVVLSGNPEQDRLMTWWLNTALNDFNATVPKTIEYGGAGSGSADLRIMGDALGELVGITDPTVAMELACWFYALGKIARLVSDYKAGRSGKSDTWFDLGIYAKMARRIQETGNWP